MGMVINMYNVLEFLGRCKWPHPNGTKTNSKDMFVFFCLAGFLIIARYLQYSTCVVADSDCVKSTRTDMWIDTESSQFVSLGRAKIAGVKVCSAETALGGDYLHGRSSQGYYLCAFLKECRRPVVLLVDKNGHKVKSICNRIEQGQSFSLRVFHSDVSLLVVGLSVVILGGLLSVLLDGKNLCN